MNNTKLPAYPAKSFDENGILRDSVGFTKLEIASIMIAGGYMANNALQIGAIQISELSVKVAKAVLEEANK